MAPDKGRKAGDIVMIGNCALHLKVCYPDCFYYLGSDCHHSKLSQNNKGTWCWVRQSLFCQEGWCTECEIFNDMIKEKEYASAAALQMFHMRGGYGMGR